MKLLPLFFCVTFSILLLLLVVLCSVFRIIFVFIVWHCEQHTSVSESEWMNWTERDHSFFQVVCVRFGAAWKNDLLNACACTCCLCYTNKSLFRTKQNNAWQFNAKKSGARKKTTSNSSSQRKRKNNSTKPEKHSIDFEIIRKEIVYFGRFSVSCRLRASWIYMGNKIWWRVREA